MKSFLMWDKYDNKYREVVDVEVARGLEADLYEANNRINDLLDIVKQKDVVINEMADYIKEPYKSVYLPQIFKARMGKREAIKKYFEERCN